MELSVLSAVARAAGTMTNNEGVYHKLVNTCRGVIGDVLVITHCLTAMKSMGSSSIIRTSFSQRSRAVKFTLNKVEQIGSTLAQQSGAYGNYRSTNSADKIRHSIHSAISLRIRVSVISAGACEEVEEVFK